MILGPLCSARTDFLDFAVSAPDRARAMQIQFHAVDIAFMRDDFGMDFEHDCPADFVSRIDRFLFAFCDRVSTTGIP